MCDHWGEWQDPSVRWSFELTFNWIIIDRLDKYLMHSLNYIPSWSAHWMRPIQNRTVTEMILKTYTDPLTDSINWRRRRMTSRILFPICSSSPAEEIPWSILLILAVKCGWFIQRMGITFTFRCIVKRLLLALGIGDWWRRGQATGHATRLWSCRSWPSV